MLFIVADFFDGISLSRVEESLSHRCTVQVECLFIGLQKIYALHTLATTVLCTLILHECIEALCSLSSVLHVMTTMDNVGSCIFFVFVVCEKAAGMIRSSLRVISLQEAHYGLLSLFFHGNLLFPDIM